MHKGTSKASNLFCGHAIKQT